MYRNRKVEQCVLDFYINLPKSIRQFSFDIKNAILSLSNFKIISYQEFAERHNISVNEVIIYCESNTGCTHKESGNYIIMFNNLPDISKERIAFTLAHELGHILLGHLNILESFKIYQSSCTNQHFERDANYFAITLLSPSPVLSKLKPKSTLSIRGIFNLSVQAAEIAFNDYLNYDKNYNISWHNDILELFDFQCDLLKFYTYQLDCACDVNDDIKPLNNNYHEKPSIYVPFPKWKWGDPIKKTESFEITSTQNLFDKLENYWLYPETLGLS